MNSKIAPKIFLFTLVLVIFSFSFVKVFSQESPPCHTRQECEELLKKYEEEIKKYEEEIQKTGKEKKTLQNQIAILKQKIEKLKLQIEQSNIMIRDTTLQIKDTEESIKKTSAKIEDQKRKIAEILRAIHEMDKKSLLEILLSENDLSGFFNNLMYLETLNSRVQDLLSVVKNLKISLEDQKMVLEKEKENLEKVLKMQTLQKQESEDLKKEKEYLSKLTEAQYQKLVAEKKEIEKEAAKIRARIFELIGVTQAPTFGEALQIAQAVSQLTGVRPAFLLAIISQESAIGRNVGQCFLSDPKTGDGIRITTRESAPRTMNPQRDVPIFLELTKKLGHDPYSTPVSCWIPLYTDDGRPFGWGGAMGPAQFIPHTWSLYESRIGEKLGKTPDPWNIKDSFLAAAIYLADLGAADQTLGSERAAANRYCGGYSWYASQVMERADCIENFIKTNTMSTYCQDLIGLR